MSSSGEAISPKRNNPRLPNRYAYSRILGQKREAGQLSHALDGINAEAIHVCHAYPVGVGLDQRVDHRRADGVIVVGEVL